MEGKEVTLELLGTTEQEIAYLAGLFDGEGCITVGREVRRGKERAKSRVNVGMTTPEPLFLYKRIFGGAISVSQRKDKRHPKTFYNWHLQGRKVELFLRVIEPYVVVKKDKLLLSLSLLGYYRSGSPRRIELADQISQRRAKKGGSDFSLPDPL